MEITGSVAKNLQSAVRSARRLRGHPVHADTLAHWRDLLHHARRALADDSTEPMKSLILELDEELSRRTS